MFNMDINSHLRWMKRINQTLICLTSITITSLVYADPVPAASVDQPILSSPDDVIKIPVPAQPAVTIPAVPATTTAAPVASATPATVDIRPVNGLISFYFQNISIKSLLQLIAKNSGLNFIISDNVKGDTTLNLKNVTWHQALDIILQSNGLA